MKKAPASGEGKVYEEVLAVIALIPAVFHPLGKALSEGAASAFWGPRTLAEARCTASNAVNKQNHANEGNQEATYANQGQLSDETGEENGESAKQCCYGDPDRCAKS